MKRALLIAAVLAGTACTHMRPVDVVNLALFATEIALIETQAPPPLCTQDDPPHTCPGTGAGVTPPPPPPPPDD